MFGLYTEDGAGGERMPAADNDFLESKTAIRFLDGKNANNALVTYYTDRHFSATEGKALIDEQYEAARLQLIQNFYTPDATATTADDFVIVDATNRSGDVAIEHFGVDKADQKNLVLAEELNDSVDGGGEADALYGGAGNDALVGDGAGLSASTAGDDVLHGGAGVDSVDYSLEDGTANQTFEAGDIAIGAPTANNEPTLLVTDTYGKTDTLISIEMLIAPGGGDAIDLDGFTGSIGIDGGGGDDTLTGGDGSDSLFGGEGFDSVTGGAGNDLLGNIHAPTYDYGALSPAERNAVAASEINANQDAALLSGGAGHDIYLIDFAPGADNWGVRIVDADAGSKILVRDILSGEIDALAGAIVSVQWMRQKFLVNVSDDGFDLGTVTIPAETYTFYGVIGSETGAFYFLGAEAQPIYRIEGGGSGADVVRYEAPSGELFNFNDPGFASAVVRFDSIAAFLGSFDPITPQQSGELGDEYSGYFPEPQQFALTIDLAQAIAPNGDIVLGPTFGGIGSAQLSDIGVTDPSPGSGPPPSASSGVSVISNADGSVTSTGSAQNDSVYSTNGPQQVALLDGYDVAVTGSSNDVIDLGADDDYAQSEGGADQIFGGAGADTIIGGAGADTIDGGQGTDLADYSGATSAVTINLANGTASGAEAAGDVLASIEHVIGSNFNDVITGAASSDTLEGGWNADVLEGGAGADLLDGGWSIDTVTYGGSASAIALDLASGGTVGDAAGDVFISIERIGGTAYNDTIAGSALADTILGGLGADQLAGAGGNDSLNGQSGNDLLSGADGDDTLDGRTNADTLVGGAGNDTFVFGTGYGFERVEDFTAGAGLGDVIRVVGFSAAFDSFAEILAAATQAGADTVIDLGAGNAMTLVGVAKTSLAADDFAFG